MVGLSMTTTITGEHKLILDTKGLCQIDPNNFEFYASLRAVLVPRGKVMHTGLVGRRLVLATELPILVSGIIVFLKNSGEGVLILFKNMHDREFVGYIMMADLKEMYADNQTKTWDDTKYLKMLHVGHENLLGFGGLVKNEPGFQRKQWLDTYREKSQLHRLLHLKQQSDIDKFFLLSWAVQLKMLMQNLQKELTARSRGDHAPKDSAGKDTAVEENRADVTELREHLNQKQEAVEKPLETRFILVKNLEPETLKTLTESDPALTEALVRFKSAESDLDEMRVVLLASPLKPSTSAPPSDVPPAETDTETAEPAKVADVPPMAAEQHSPGGTCAVESLESLESDAPSDVSIAASDRAVILRGPSSRIADINSTSKQLPFTAASPATGPKVEAPAKVSKARGGKRAAGSGLVSSSEKRVRVRASQQTVTAVENKLQKAEAKVVELTGVPAPARAWWQLNRGFYDVYADRRPGESIFPPFPQHVSRSLLHIEHIDTWSHLMSVCLAEKLSNEKIARRKDSADQTAKYSKLALDKHSVDVQLDAVRSVAAATLAAAVATVQKEQADKVKEAMKEGHEMAVAAMMKRM